MWTIILSGLFSWFSLVREVFPHVESKQVSITAIYPNATPEEIEKSVTIKIEQAIKGIQDVREIHSKVLDSTSITTVSFHEKIDYQRRFEEIKTRINQARERFPKEVEDPLVEESQSLIASISVIVYGDVPEDKLKQEAKKIEQDLRSLPGASTLALEGIRKPEIWVNIRPETLEEFELTFEEVGQILAFSNLDTPGGSLKSSSGNIQLRVLGEEKKLNDLEEIIIRSDSEGKTVRLKDIALIENTYEDTVVSSYFKGKRAIRIIVLQAPGQDTIKIAKVVKEYVRKNPSRLGGAIKLSARWDISSFISERIDLMIENARNGFILVLLGLVLFMNLEIAFWTAMGMVVSFLGTFVLMNLLGITINFISLIGFMIVLGLVVDDAIVVGENIFAKRQSGMRHDQAAVMGAAQVIKPVLATVITTVAAFLPLFFLTGSMGATVSEIPKVVIAALLISLLDSFSILPSHLSGHKVTSTKTKRRRTRDTSMANLAIEGTEKRQRLVNQATSLSENEQESPSEKLTRDLSHLKHLIIDHPEELTKRIEKQDNSKKKRETTAKILKRIPFLKQLVKELGEGDAKDTIVLKLRHKKESATWQKNKTSSGLSKKLQALGKKRNHFLENTLPGYMGKILAFALPWRYIVLALSLSFLCLVVGMMQGGVIPFELIPDLDSKYISVDVQMNSGSKEVETREMLVKIEKLALSLPEVNFVYSIVGGQFLGKMVSDTDPRTVGKTMIEFLPAEERRKKNLRTSAQVIQFFRKELRFSPKVKKISFVSSASNPFGGVDIDILVKGTNDELTSAVANQVKKKLASYRGVVDIVDNLNKGKREVILRLKEGGRALGLTTHSLASLIHHALSGFEAQKLQINSEEVAVRIMLPESARRNLSNLSPLRIATPLGTRVPLEEVAFYTYAKGFESINRINGERVINIRAQVDRSLANVNQITQALNEDLKEISSRHPGIVLSLEGKSKSSMESTRRLLFGFPLAFLLIYGTLAVLFRSYLQPFIIMLIIPYAIAGAIVGHFIMGYPITFMSMVGMVGLMGIVVNDSLIVVTFINELKKEGKRTQDAVTHAVQKRLRSILLTTITTALGMIPLLLSKSLQAQFLSPIAVSLVFGLLFATFLTLVMIPIFSMILRDMENIWLSFRIRQLQKVNQPKYA